MGWDLMIIETEREYRDPWNPLNSWWPLGMSYLQMRGTLEDKRLYLDGMISPDGVAYVWSELEQHPLTDDKIDGHLNTYAADFNVTDMADRAEWVTYFMNRDREMRDFWREAVECGSGVWLW